MVGAVGSNTAAKTTASKFYYNAASGILSVVGNIAYISPDTTKTISAKMLNTGVLSFEGANGQLFSISDSATGTLFSVNDTSGIPLIEVIDTGVIKFNSTGGFVSYGVSTAVSAAGTTQGTATALTRPVTVVSTVAGGSADGVIMPSATAGMRVIVINTSATALNVYPASGGAINAAATNAAYVLPAGARLEYVAVSTVLWYTINATYA